MAYYGRSAVSFRPRTESDPSNPGITLTHFTSVPNGGSKTVYRIHIKEPQLSRRETPYSMTTKLSCFGISQDRK